VEETVSAADANSNFPQLLRGVREGRSYLVTSRGEPVARIVPAGRCGGATTGARAALLDRLRSEPVVETGRWTRDELYEDEPQG